MHAQPAEIYVDDESKLTLHGLVQHYVMLHEEEKNRKLTDLLDALDFNQVGGSGALPFSRKEQQADGSELSNGGVFADGGVLTCAQPAPCWLPSWALLHQSCCMIFCMNVLVKTVLLLFGNLLAPNILQA